MNLANPRRVHFCGFPRSRIKLQVPGGAVVGTISPIVSVEEISGFPDPALDK